MLKVPGHQRRSDDTLSMEFAACRAALRTSLVASSGERVVPTIDRFERFVVETTGHERLRDFGLEDVSRFVSSRTSSGGTPSSATIHNRRAALRCLFRTARELGLLDGDPTLDLELPAKTNRAARPLTDAEIRLGRDAAQWSLTSRRFTAVWALAETTARGSELARVRWRDVDVDNGQVDLPGGGAVRPRVGLLTEWGTAALRHARLDVTDSSSSVLYTGRDPSVGGRVSASNAISTVLVRAGLARKCDVRPGSIAAWAARKRMAETGDIAEVARMLGVGSLDVAARTICWDWTKA